MADEVLELVADDASEILPSTSTKSSFNVHPKQSFFNEDKNASLQEQLPSVVPLSVGGRLVVTRLSTLRKYPDSMLAVMFSGRHKLDKDSQGNYFIDGNGEIFSHILEYLRNETLPPNDMACKIYKEACYLNIAPLAEALQTSPQVSKQIVMDAHRKQFPDYAQTKKNVIRIAMDNATVNRTGEVLIHAFHKKFTPKSSYFNLKHECVGDMAHLSVGPWDSAADEDALLKCLEYDLMAEGFHVKPRESKRRCKYYNGQNCQKVVYKIAIFF